MGQIVEFEPIAHWNGSILCNFKSQQMKPIYHWKHFNNSMFFGGLYQILIKLTHPKNTTFETPTPNNKHTRLTAAGEPNISRDLLQQAFGTGPWWRESHLGLLSRSLMFFFWNPVNSLTGWFFCFFVLFTIIYIPLIYRVLKRVS